LFQDHRDSNLEAVGVTMVCGLHQAIPSRFQVTVPIRDIWDRGTVVRSGCKHGIKMKMEIFTSYQCLQSHATLAFGLEASGDVPEVMLQMPNAAA
jgi:hypothetical protein